MLAVGQREGGELRQREGELRQCIFLCMRLIDELEPHRLTGSSSQVKKVDNKQSFKA